MSSFKRFILEYKQHSGQGGGGEEDYQYPYLMWHNPENKTSWFSMGIDGGGPMTVIEMDNAAHKAAKSGTPTSTGYMSIGRAKEIHDTYGKDPDLARHMIMQHLDTHYHTDGQKVKLDGKSHPQFDTMAKLKIPGSA